MITRATARVARTIYGYRETFRSIVRATLAVALALQITNFSYFVRFQRNYLNNCVIFRIV
jgi:hypothetical protein